MVFVAWDSSKAKINKCFGKSLHTRATKNNHFHLQIKDQTDLKSAAEKRKGSSKGASALFWIMTFVRRLMQQQDQSGSLLLREDEPNIYSSVLSLSVLRSSLDDTRWKAGYTTDRMQLNHRGDVEGTTTTHTFTPTGTCTQMCVCGLREKAQNPQWGSLNQTVQFRNILPVPPGQKTDTQNTKPRLELLWRCQTALTVVH